VFLSPFAERSPVFSDRFFCGPGERELKGHRRKVYSAPNGPLVWLL